MKEGVAICKVWVKVFSNPKRAFLIKLASVLGFGGMVGFCVLGCEKQAPDGSISACTSIRGKHIQGNIYQDDFMSVWESRFEKYRDRAWAKKGACKSCKMWSFCQGNGMHHL